MTQLPHVLKRSSLARSRAIPVASGWHRDLPAVGACCMLGSGRQDHGRRVMRANEHTRTAAEILVDQLVIHGARHVFCVPGESYIAALDAFYDRDIAITVCRHESGAAIMAEACGKLTGKPGICFVTRGPGATNAAAGVHIAHQDSTPLLLFVSQVARDALGREAFQELNYGAVFGTMAKWVVQIDEDRAVVQFLEGHAAQRIARDLADE